MVLPHLQMIQSHLYYFYTNGQWKQGTDAILVAAIASPYLSRQVSAFRRFRQFLLPISCRLYMQAVDAGLRNFLNAITLRYSTFRVT